jgi:hypothetical protein
MVKEERIAVLFIPILAYLGMRADLRRRRLSLWKRAGWKIRTILDVSAFVAALAVGAFRFTQIEVATAMLLCIVAICFLWSEGKKQVTLQRPAGLVFAELCILIGAYLLFFHGGGHSKLHFGPLAAGVALIGLVVPQFIRGREQHRIVEDIESRLESRELSRAVRAESSRLRRRILRRDHYGCRGCDRDGVEVTLAVYPIHLNASHENNMLSLCRECFNLVERKNITANHAPDFLRKLWYELHPPASSVSDQREEHPECLKSS